MTLKLWQIKPKLNYSNDVIDIVQFGSSITDEKTPNDIDIAVIFKKILLKDQLEQSQKIKSQLQKLSELPVHIKSFDFYSFFDKNNFAKEKILFYGKSLIYSDNFSRRLGFDSKIYIFYSLKNLKKKEKVKFNYSLNGKKGEYGLLRKYGGRLLKPGLIEIPPEYENLFTNSIKKITSDFELQRIFF